MSVSPAAAQTATYAMTMLVAKDLEATKNYYSNIFGLAVRSFSPAWAELELGGGLTLALHPPDPADHLDVVPGSQFLSFTVGDVDAFVTRASAQGARVAVPPRDEPFGRFAILLDPDSYPVQVFALNEG